MSKNRLNLTMELIERFDRPVPRYTSFPMVPQWSSDYSNQDHINHLEKMRDRTDPISFYIHIPFCYRRCFFCGCNVKITNKRPITESYLDLLEKEIKTVTKYIGTDKKISQLHLGGGTPTHLEPKQLDQLMDIVDSNFSFVKGAEQSIEVHPSVTSFEHLDVLKNRGFNRLSMGVQDFDPLVQEKINRYQTYEETKKLVEYARQLDFLGVNTDLIYGLPYQTKEGFGDTLEKILEIKPDRLAVYSYAHLPTVMKHQSIFPIDVIPTGEPKMNLFLQARNALLDNGYEAIGFDHFSLPTDELYTAEQNKTLLRNFMGYTTQAGHEMVAVGFSSISDITHGYSQNSKHYNEYAEMIEKDGLAVVKGLNLTDEDVVNKEAIMKFMCQYTYDPTDMKNYYDSVNKSDHMTEIYQQLDHFLDLNLLTKANGIYEATDLGKVFARIVASAFDTYIKNSVKINAYSKAV